MARNREIVPANASLMLTRAGVDVILFDLDDLFLKTNSEFVLKVDEASDFVSEVANLPREKIRDKIGVYIKEAHDSMGVAPEIWDNVAGKLRRDFSLIDPEIFISAAKIIKDVYLVAPAYHYGAEKLLQGLSSQGVRMGLVTHANFDYTVLKFTERRMGRFFERVKVVDEWGKKSATEWALAITEMGVRPERVLVSGDNLKNDIQAAHEIGVRKLIWVNRSDGWSAFRRGELPNGAVEIPRITHFFDAVSHFK